MQTLASIAAVLAERLRALRTGKLALARDAGITPRTLGHVLSGVDDFKVSTLLAVADRLDLELVLIPKDAARGLPPVMPSPANVPTAVEAALARLRRTGSR